jgi:hypothetical protein
MSEWPSVIRMHPQIALESSAPPEVRDAARDLSARGVPEELLGGRYRSTDAITYLPCGKRMLLQFGTGLGSPMCLDVSTGEIVTVAPKSTVQFVNSSLERFVDTAVAVTALFPFYGEAEIESEAEGAGFRVADAIRSVEPRAMDRDLFWSTLVDDITMGDFATEWIVKSDRG